ncbi:MAG TPA: xanthine dehydrogenase family protein molybdopterin-binding subunit [Xanthobacteraceae bacterium]|nr:xanthine dehydrogenase family protein molybdopterin-binding subunit [Xanthobacteraceae bacterium]
MLTRDDTHESLPLGPSTGIGRPVRRKEDLRLVVGQGCYSDDVNLPGQAYAVMVRSPHAHARIRAIETAAARAAPGVLAVLTGRDMLADGVKPIPHKQFSYHPAEIPLKNKSGAPIFAASHYPLPADRARYVGEAVAVVVAETVAAAKDAAELVAVDYVPLPAVTDAVAGAEPEAPRLWDEAENVLIDAEVGDADKTAAAFAKAAHVVRLTTWIPRVTGVPMEPRAAVGEWDASRGRYTVHAGSGGAVRLKTDIAASLDVPEDSVRAVMREVGGNFGTRGAIYPEFVLVAWAARRVGRPVKWTCERHESFLSDYQGRDLTSEAELALDAKGRFLAIRGSNTGNLGALTANFSMVQKGVEIMSSIYRMPTAHFRARCVTTNTAPTRPYRSAGRPEVMFVMERLIDLAARQHGFDRLALRRRNLLNEAELPYTNPFGMTYDSGDYHKVMAQAAALADWDGFAARRRAAKKRGKLRGIGVANYVDTATGVPRERAEVTVQPDGFVDVVLGTVSNGQGHETSFAQLVTEWLGVPIERVRLITGDTDIVKVGGGTHSGRGMRLASITIHKASGEIVARGIRIARHLLEADAAAQIVFRDGRFVLEGTNRSVGLFEAAAAAHERDDLPDDLRGALAAVCDETVKDASFPYGCHVCEVEIDPDTGTLEIVRHVAVDDVGRAVNPMIIHGQTHGGIVQGVGQALFEHCFYDAESGQPLTGSFMDYAMPRAAMLPFFTTAISEVPSTTHPLGMRPAGEGGTTPALAVIVNAIVDALAEFGVTHIEMPATPERIWRAIHGKADRSRSNA